MTRQFIISKLVIPFMLLSGLGFAGEPTLSSAALCETLSALVQPGDLVFVEIDNFVLRRVARATGGWANHVGVVLEHSSQGWTVAESKVPLSQTGSLCDLLERTRAPIAIRRHNRIWAANDMNDIKREVRARLGIAYDMKFNFDSKKQYCSKFVYEIFKAALDLELGKIETLGDIMDNMKDLPTYEEDLAFWEFYYGGEIPRNQRIVTPESQYRDANLRTIFDNSRWPH